MKKFFSYFPKVRYSLDDALATYDTVTDVTFLVSLLEPYTTNKKYYYRVILKDGLKPEDVAFLVYGDSGLHWLVLHFNKIIDPQFDWPMSQYQLEQNIARKYGSIANAQATIKAYYRLVKKLIPGSTSFYTERIELNEADYANTTINLSGTYVPLKDGTTVTIIEDKETLSAYDWELQQNENRREIILLQKEYVSDVLTNLEALAK